MKNIIENYKNFNKWAKKNQKKRDQIRIIIIIEKTKTTKDKIESHKIFNKRAKDKNKKLKVENWKTTKL